VTVISGGAGEMHYTPTSSSWLNLVERLFAEITRQQIRRSAFKSVADLEAAIDAWIAAWNAKPTPFKWSAKASATSGLSLQIPSDR
jgi:hypothetical protein